MKAKELIMALEKFHPDQEVYIYSGGHQATKLEGQREMVIRLKSGNMEECCVVFGEDSKGLFRENFTSYLAV